MQNPNRFAAIADIHGNRWALEAVLEDIHRRNIPQTVNLGDLLWGPLDHEGTLALLAPHNFPTIRGNQHRGLLDLPFSLEFPGILLFHGTPSHDDVYLLETVHPDGVTLANDEEIAARLGSVPQHLLLCGHTHVPRVVNTGNHLIVNPGSVGLQAYEDDTPIPHKMETGSPHARYAILERTENSWRAEFIHLPYDHESAAQTALRNNRPDWAHRLRTGRAR